MRARKVLIISGFLMTWTFVTYFFLLRDNAKLPLSPRSRVAQKLTHLQNSAIGEYHKSKVFMETIVDLLRIKYLTESEEQTETLREVSTGGAAATLPPALSAPRNEKNKSGIGIVPLSPEHPLSIPKPDSVENVIAPNDNDRIAQAAKTAKAVVTHMPNGQPIIPVVVFACNRVSIKKCLDNLVQYRPSMEQFPIIVSQDCGDQATKNMILSFKEKVQLIEQPDLTDIQVPPKEKKFKGYYKIARHYGWALNEVFSRGYEFVIIVEDDLNVAPDFYEYFLGTYKLLQQDSSLWCVSAWNDNGKANFVDPSHPELLYRTDFFPGLGWMLSRNLWQELSVKWPKSFWDDWIRHPEQRKNRVCIRPEISRTRTFGKIGVSNGLFFDKYLRYIKLSEDYVEFTKMNLSYLLRDNYDRTFLKRVYAYPIVTYDELRRNLITTDEPVRIQYNTKDQYKRITKLLGLMDDFKSGVPRTAYHGIVSFFYNKRRVHLAPNINWKGYDLSWS